MSALDLYADLDLRPRHVRQKDDNEAHANKPEPGDYWHDCFSPVCVVLDFDSWEVTYCQKIKAVEGNRWTFDLAQIETKNVEEFKNWLAYKSIPGYWAHVIPGNGQAFVDIWRTP